MSNTTQTAQTEQSVQIVKLSMAELTALVVSLQERITTLEASKTTPKESSTREMTDDDARRILTGDLSTSKHKDAAQTLGLSYGQIYSCRLEFTFKAIHQEMRAKGQKNIWVK